MGILSIGGLVSGLDTDTIIDQLMQVEANPQTLLKQKVTTQQSVITAFQALNAKIAGLATKAEALSSSAGWGGLAVTSSTDKVSATATSKATAGTIDFTVLQTARGHQLSFTQTAASSDRVTDPASTMVRLTKSDGTVVDIDTGDGTLDGLVQAVNKSSAGVRASTVRLDDGTSRLRLDSTSTGATAAFTLTNVDGTDLLGGATITSAAQDAAIKVGSDIVHSANNTFTGAIAGLDITIASTTAANTEVQLNVSLDTDAATASVKALIDAANDIISNIDTLTAYDPATKAAGVLSGDPTVRELRNSLLNSVSTGVGGTSLADVGIQLDRTGTIVFDETAFATAYTADPVKTAGRFVSSATWSGTGDVTMNSSSWRTQPGSYVVDANAGTIGGKVATVNGSYLTGAANSPVDGLMVKASAGATGTLTFTQGFAAKLAALAQYASDPNLGSVSTTIKGGNDNVKQMNDAITSWDDRLAIRRASLERQYAALEVSLNSLKNQGNWLAGQISSLPTNSSSSSN